MTTHRCAGFVLLALLVSALTGCGDRTASVSCPSWAGFTTPQEKYDAADLVVVTSSSTRDGTARVFGVDAHSYEIVIDDVLKGGPLDGTVRISSMPDPCSGTAQYPDGDPLDTSDPLVVFAAQQDGGWFTLTPLDGTLPYTQDVVDALRWSSPAVADRRRHPQTDPGPMDAVMGTTTERAAVRGVPASRPGEEVVQALP